MDPAEIICPVCLAYAPCACPDAREYGDTLIVRLCLGAFAEAEAQRRYLEGRTIDVTGDKYIRAQRRIWQLSLVQAWCIRQLWRRRICVPLPTDHDAIGAGSVESIAL